MTRNPNKLRQPSRTRACATRPVSRDAATRIALAEVQVLGGCGSGACAQPTRDACVRTGTSTTSTRATTAVEEPKVATLEVPHRAGRQSVAFASLLSWSQSGHLPSSLTVMPMADVIVILAAISAAWTEETLMLTANTSPRIEVSVRRSQEQVMVHSMGICRRTASRIPLQGCDLTTRAPRQYSSRGPLLPGIVGGSVGPAQPFRISRMLEYQTMRRSHAP